MIICPNCLKEIPDDSVYCDQCGKPVLGKKDFVEVTVAVAESQSIDSQPTQLVTINKSIPLLKLKHETMTLSINDGDILGRTIGPFANELGIFKVISSRHAQIKLSDNKWFVTDLQSTNSTFINQNWLEPDKQYEIRNGDILTLANIDFSVTITE